MKMKMKMKRLILTMSFVLIGVLGYSQATPTQALRIANATTAFDVNISVGKTVYNIATDELWICKTATASDETLTTAAANFTIVNGANTDSQTLSTDGTAGNITITNGNTITLNVDDADASSTNEIQSSSDFTLAGLSEHSYNSLTEKPTLGDLSGDLDDITDGATYVKSHNDYTDTEKTKLSNIEPYAEVNLTTFVESFEETSSTAATHDLSHTAIGAIKVSFNGVVLKPSQYTATSTTVHIDIPVSQYDGLVVYYSY